MASRRKDNDMWCDCHNMVQLFYPMELSANDDRELDTPESHREFVPDALEAFSSSFCGKTFVLTDSQLPEGVLPANHFLTFDSKIGLALCIGFYIDMEILHNTDEFKKILNTLNEEVEGQFHDGWGESPFNFRHGEDTFYMSPDYHLAHIVAPVKCCSFLAAKWASIDEIDHVEWMLNHEYVYNLMCNPREFVKEYEFYKKKKITDRVQALDYVKANSAHLIFT